MYVSTGSNPQNVDDMNVYIRGDLKLEFLAPLPQRIKITNKSSTLNLNLVGRRFKKLKVFRNIIFFIFYQSWEAFLTGLRKGSRYFQNS